MIAVIDNYDSFTYNLVQILAKNNLPYVVYKNDSIDSHSLVALKNKLSGFLISPGPGHPDQAGISREIVDLFHKTHPIFGVCLGHQVLGKYFGANVKPAKKPIHGYTSLVYHSGDSYRGLKQPLQVMRYHSLIVEDLPECLMKTSWTIAEDGSEEIMGFRHREWPLEGVQFHPESILSEGGEALLLQFFKT